MLTSHMVEQRCKMSCSEVTKLNAWGASLEDVSLIKEMPNLEIVSLSLNKISSLAAFANCTSLVELYLRGNSIASLDELRHLSALSNLRTLWLAQNPCAEMPEYRARAIAELPQLRKLDSDPVTEEERKQAVAQFSRGAASKQVERKALQPVEHNVAIAKQALAKLSKARARAPKRNKEPNEAPARRGVSERTSPPVVPGRINELLGDPTGQPGGEQGQASEQPGQRESSANSSGRSNKVQAVMCLLASLDDNGLREVSKGALRELQQRGLALPQGAFELRAGDLVQPDDEDIVQPSVLRPIKLQAEKLCNNDDEIVIEVVEEAAPPNMNMLNTLKEFF